MCLTSGSAAPVSPSTVRQSAPRSGAAPKGVDPEGAVQALALGCSFFRVPKEIAFRAATRSNTPSAFSGFLSLEIFQAQL